jgi:hypothetical protein
MSMERRSFGVWTPIATAAVIGGLAGSPTARAGPESWPRAGPEAPDTSQTFIEKHFIDSITPVSESTALPVATKATIETPPAIPLPAGLPVGLATLAAVIYFNRSRPRISSSSRAH